MTLKLDSSIVRIFKKRNAVGCGFLIEPKQVITCAHVINQSINLSTQTDKIPADETNLEIDFPRLDPGNKIPARVTKSGLSSLNKLGDIALLEPLAELPQGAEPAPVAVDDDYWGHDFRAFGFPANYQDGVWASGRVLGKDAVGWLIIEDTRQTGYFIEPGFSGTPVWDNVLNRVIGVVVAVDIDPARRTAFIMPSERLLGQINSIRMGYQIIDDQIVPLEVVVPPPSDIFQPQLEYPTGVVRLNSPFYIERKDDLRLAEEMSGNGTITTIFAGRQTGKTSLLIRGVNNQRQKNRKVVFVDFQRIPEGSQQSLDKILKHIAISISRDLKLDGEIVENIWATSWGAADKFDEYMVHHILNDAEAPILLAMDEVDKLLSSPFKNDFFGLIRGWNTQQAYDLLWQNLNVVMVISTHPLLLIENYRQSPFNVGVTIRLQDFTLEQVGRLNWLHGMPLDPKYLPEMMELFGGHPFLTRMAFYTLAKEKIDWARLKKNAPSKTGPFGSHLQYYWQHLNQNPDLVRSMREVIKRGQCPDEAIRYRLMAAGLIRQEEDCCVPRCGLYKHLV